MGCGNYKFVNYNNYIVAEININNDNIIKDIKIINEYKNEIKKKCIIKINNEIIKFNYYYKFKREGEYK